MVRGQWIGGSVTVGVLLSTLVHAGAGGGLYYALVIDKPEPIEVEIDLSMVPLVPPDTAPTEPPPPAAPPPPPPTWTLPKPEELPPPPVVEETPEPEPPPTQVVEEAQPEPQEVPPPPVEQVASVSAADIEKRYLPASQAARQPRWVGNRISDNDYPRVAKRDGKDGLVVVSVLIDEAGRVQDVRLLRGSYEELNDVALRKVREGIFTPAYNGDGQAVAIKAMLPVRFELEQGEMTR
jgi:protein TonB